MESSANELLVTVQEGSSWGRRLSITVPAERVRRTRGKVAAMVTQGVRMPGFRKGKLPESVVEQRFGAEIDQETIDRLIQETYKEALDREGITPISQGKVDQVQFDRGSDMVFDVEVEIRPEIELSQLSGFSARRPEEEVTEVDVDAVMERLRDDRAEWDAIEAGQRPGVGDQVLVEIVALDEGDSEEPRNYRLVLGTDQAIPDVEAAVATLTTGETGEFSVSFPDDFPTEERRGQSQKLRIRLDEAQVKRLPVADDDFAKKVGDFEDMAALRARILSDLKDEAVGRAESEVRRQLVDQILEANPFDVPGSMLERYLDYMLGEGDDHDHDHDHHNHRHQHRRKQQRTPEQEERYRELRESLVPQASWGLKRTLVVERIAASEGLAATQDEIDERVEELAKQNNRTPSEVWIQLEKSGQLDALERDILEEKVFDFLKSRNTVA
ncbi:MAG: trigger factor [Gemmatimonadota bacterium]|jgi:trigger factor|nr:trigger factor [Gemmatimonadota bacterium]